MAKVTFTCSNCGASHSKWTGQCDSCMEWNTLVDQGPLSAGPGKTLGGKRGRTITLTDLATAEEPPARTMAGVAELDRVLGADWSRPARSWLAGIPVSENPLFCCKPQRVLPATA